MPRKNRPRRYWIKKRFNQKHLFTLKRYRIFPDSKSGRKFAGIKYTEWEKIPDLFNFFLSENYIVFTHNKLGARFDPDDTFSWSEMELRSIRATENFYQSLRQDGKTEKEDTEFVLGSAKDACICYWNWHTQVGKDYCTTLRQRLGLHSVDSEEPRYLWKGYDETCAKYGVLHRGGWSHYEPSMETIDELLLN